MSGQLWFCDEAIWEPHQQGSDCGSLVLQWGRSHPALADRPFLELALQRLWDSGTWGCQGPCGHRGQARSVQENVRVVPVCWARASDSLSHCRKAEVQYVDHLSFRQAWHDGSSNMRPLTHPSNRIYGASPVLQALWWVRQLQHYKQCRCRPCPRRTYSLVRETENPLSDEWISPSHPTICTRFQIFRGNPSE